MKKKLLSVVLCAVMVAGMAVGCGSKSDSASSANADSSSDSASGGGKIVYWSMWSEEEPQAKVIKEAVEKYTADTGVEVDLQFKGRNGQREGLEPALQAKQQIDLFDEDVNRVNGSWGSYLMDLEDLAADYEKEHGNATLFQIARNAAGGTLKSIPYQPSIFGVFYNKTLFTKAGIDTVPTTWAELDDVCKKLVDAGITPITGDTTYQTSVLGYHLGRYLGQDGVKALVNDPTCEDPDAVNWDDPRVLQALKDYEDFAAKGYFSDKMASNVYPDGQNKEYAPGEAAIIVCGSWLPNEIKAMIADDLEWGYFNYPAVENGTDGTEANNIANQVLAINKDSKVANEAMELITYITTGDFDKKMTEEALCIPTDTANADAWPAELAEVKTGFDATTTYYDWAVGCENNADLTASMQEGFVKLMVGQMTAEDLIAECAGICGE